MQLSSLLGGLGKPNTKAFEAPIRAIVHEVLREQGYASPAEVQALRDQARELKSRVDAAMAKVAALESAPAPAPAPAAPAGPDPRVAELEARVAALSAEVAELRARPVAAPAAPAAPAPAAEPLAAAARGTCKVPGCEEGVRSKGFCSAHYQQFRRGTLKGFVGPDGTVEAGGRVVSVGAEHAGGRLEVEGSKVLVDGQQVLDLAG